MEETEETLVPWPLVMLIEADYVPELAVRCLEAVEEFSDYEHAAIIMAEAYYAETKLTKN